MWIHLKAQPMRMRLGGVICYPYTTGLSALPDYIRTSMRDTGLRAHVYISGKARVPAV